MIKVCCETHPVMKISSFERQNCQITKFHSLLKFPGLQYSGAQ